MLSVARDALSGLRGTLTGCSDVLRWRGLFAVALTQSAGLDLQPRMP